METKNTRPLFHKRDVWLFAAILVPALAVYAALAVWPAQNGAYGRISADGAVVLTVDLSEDAAFGLPQNPRVRFAVRGGAVAFTESDCPDKICVRSGFLSRPGQMAACLPNRVSLVVAGTDGADSADAVAS